MVQEGPAEIAFGGMARPIEELDHQWPIEAVTFRNDLDISRGGVGPRDGCGEIAGKARQGEADDQNGHAHRGGQQQSTEKERVHWKQLPWGASDSMSKPWHLGAIVARVSMQDPVQWIAADGVVALDYEHILAPPLHIRVYGVQPLLYLKQRDKVGRSL